MCRCTPNMRTPFCGVGDCQWYEQISQNKDKTELSPKRDKTYAEVCLERAEKATPGPWQNDGMAVYITEDNGFIMDFMVRPNDARFIAHSRTDVEELAKRLKRACEAMRSEEYIESPGYFKCLADELEALPTE